MHHINTNFDTHAFNTGKSTALQYDKLFASPYFKADQDARYKFINMFEQDHKLDFQQTCFKQEQPIES